MLYFNDGVTIKDRVSSAEAYITESGDRVQTLPVYNEEEKSLKTTIPFVKNNEFDYYSLISWMGDWTKDYAYLLFIPIVIFIITAVSNGANLTDGIDGLATGTSAIIGITLGIFAYVSGSIIFADYLNIMKMLSKIINARVVEIIEQVYLEIKNYGYNENKKKLIAGIVLTGGGSELKHIKQLVEFVTGMKLKILLDLFL